LINFGIIAIVKPKAKTNAIEARNELDTFIFSTEKSVKDYGDKLSGAEKKEIEEALKEAKEKMEKASTKEEYNQIKDELAKKAQKIGEILYAEMQKQQAAGANAQGANFDSSKMNDTPQDEKPKDDDGPVDADFEVVDDK